MTYDDTPDFTADRRAAEEWARGVLADSNAIIFDSETTNLHGYFVQVGLLSIDGTMLLDSLVNPQCAISDDAQRIHGISAEHVASAPTYSELHARFVDLTRGKRIVVYNASFDHSILERELMRLFAQMREQRGQDAAYWELNTQVNEWVQSLRWECAMHQYSAWVGDWNSYHGNYRWQRLPAAPGVDAHSARGDCLSTLAVLKRMAEQR